MKVTQNSRFWPILPLKAKSCFFRQISTQNISAFLRGLPAILSTYFAYLLLYDPKIHFLLRIKRASPSLILLYSSSSPSLLSFYSSSSDTIPIFPPFMLFSSSSLSLCRFRSYPAHQPISGRCPFWPAHQFRLCWVAIYGPQYPSSTTNYLRGMFFHEMSFWDFDHQHSSIWWKTDSSSA